MGRLEDNQTAIIAESIDIFDAFITSAEIEIKDEPRTRVYSDWKAKYDFLIIKWGFERIVIFFALLFAVVFIWRTQYTYEVKSAFKMLATFGVLVMTKRMYGIESVTHANEASDAIIRYINTHKDYFIFPEEDNHGGEELQSQKREDDK